MTTLADQLNRGCYCRTLDEARLKQELLDDQEDADLYLQTLESRPHLFSSTSVFISPEQAQQMQALVRAVEAVVAHPEYRRTLGEWSPLPDFVPPTAGAFMGFDFHLGEQGPRLIEINTNAGGAFLNVALLRAQIACCADVTDQMSQQTLHLNRQFMQMFESEWHLQRGKERLRTIAIVDDGPSAQYLFPEFQLAERWFRRQGYAAIIVDAAELHWQNGQLLHQSTPVDLVYNRLTDFSLSEPRHAALRQAWLQDSAVVTPNPYLHAIYANKRNLTLLTDADLLRSWGIDDATIATLITLIPATTHLTPARADEFWEKRREYFFKPASGFGGRAAYRGDKLTRKTWEEIKRGDYIAQQKIPPGERALTVNDEPLLHKMDIRAYTYAGRIQMFAARLYQGQTTNFRTPGGGFAAVFEAG